MKKCCLALAALLPLTAFAYPIEIEKQLNGAEVSVSPLEIDRNMGGVILYNYGETGAECRAVFRNGPEAPRTRSATLKAGEDKLLSLKTARDIIRLRIDVTCKVS